MKKENLFEAIGEVSEKNVVAARKGLPGSTRHTWTAAVVACLAVVFAVTAGFSVMLNRTGSSGVFDLSKASSGVTVEYTDNAKVIPINGKLVMYSEEELFTVHNFAAFKGTVEKIRNIEIDFGGQAIYRAIAEIKVEKVYKGDCRKNDVVSVLLPCAVDFGMEIEDTAVASSMRAGMTGIFMPITYGEDDTYEQNGGVLALCDVAKYGFMDGMRSAILETAEGLIFADWAYTGMADAENLEQAEEYVVGMIEKTAK